jgi:hypothetical protein
MMSNVPGSYCMEAEICSNDLPCFVQPLLQGLSFFRRMHGTVNILSKYRPHTCACRDTYVIVIIGRIQPCQYMNEFSYALVQTLDVISWLVISALFFAINFLGSTLKLQPCIVPQ